MTTVNDIPSEITAVLNGQMDAAFVFEGARNVFASKFSDNDLMKDLKVLYLTEGDIPNDAIAVQPDMDKELKAKSKSFLGMKTIKKEKKRWPYGVTKATKKLPIQPMIRFENNTKKAAE